MCLSPPAFHDEGDVFHHGDVGEGIALNGDDVGEASGLEGADLVFVTCDYDFGAPAALQAQKAGKISVFLCAEDPKAGIVGVGPYSFSASAAAQVQGATIAEWAYKEKNVRNAPRLPAEPPKPITGCTEVSGSEIVPTD